MATQPQNAALKQGSDWETCRSVDGNRKCATNPSSIWRCCFCFCFFLLSLPGSTVASLFLSDASFSVWRRLRRTTPSSWTRRALKVGLCSPQLLHSHRGNRSDCVISGSLRRPCLSTLCRYGLWLADWVNPCHYTHFSRVTFLSCRGDRQALLRNLVQVFSTGDWFCCLAQTTEQRFFLIFRRECNASRAASQDPSLQLIKHWD